MKAATLCLCLLAGTISSAIAVPVPDDCETTLSPDQLRELLESRWSEFQSPPTPATVEDDSFDGLEDSEATLTINERVRKVLDIESPVESSFLLRIPELDQHENQQHGDEEHTNSFLSMPTAALKSLRLAETETERVRLCTIRSQKHAADAAESAYGKRGYGDLLIVGLVVLFIAAVLVVELLEKIWPSVRSRYIEGRIRLEDTKEKQSPAMQVPPTWKRSIVDTR